MAAHELSVIQFGPYELDLRSGELRKGRTKIHLQLQPFQILVALLQRPGEVVTREEIRNILWPDGTAVEYDHGINAAVKRLRDVLRESADQPRYVETLARRGYRFIGEVRRPAAGEPNGATAAEPPPAVATSFDGFAAAQVENRKLRGSSVASSWNHSFRIFTLAALVVAAATIGFWSYRAHAQVRWAREVAIPEAIRLAEAGKATQAFSFIWKAHQIVPDDPTLNQIWREVSHPLAILTNPSGATIWAKSYDQPNAEWLRIGTSPIENFLLPLGYFRWKVSKAGFRTVEGAGGIPRRQYRFHVGAGRPCSSGRGTRAGRQFPVKQFGAGSFGRLLDR